MTPPRSPRATTAEHGHVPSEDRGGRSPRLGRAFRLVWEASPGLTAAGGMLWVLEGVLPLAALYLLKLVVDAVAAAIADPDAGLRRVFALLAVAGAVLVVTSLCRAVSSYIQTAQGQAVRDHVEDLIHAQSADLDLRYFENPEYFDLLHVAQREGTYRPAQIVAALGRLGQNGVSLAGVVGLLLTFRWWIPLVLLAAAVPGSILRLRRARRLHNWQRQRAVEERRASYFHMVLTGEAYARELRLFGLADLFRGRFRGLRDRLRSERLGFAREQSSADVIGQACASVALILTLAFIAQKTVGGHITLGDLVMYSGALQRGLGYFQDLLTALTRLYEDNLFLSNLDEFLAIEPRVLDPALPEPAPRPMRHGIVFDDVAFRYPDSERAVLRGIRLAIRPGEVIGLVGENGAGKTTLVKLLCRFYDPTEGRITLDGIELSRFSTSDLRQQLSVVFQDYRRYYTTARENIWFGDIGRPVRDEALESAARDSGFDGVVSRFPSGYETVMGRWLENGEELSIGELQKLALARALFRDAQVLVLDEPTSAMDAKSEYELFRKIKELAGSRAVVLVSHRLSTLRLADRIYVLRDGELVESGTHQQLVSRGGAYADLYETQARAYR